jgi:hypothetical protein
MGPQGLAGPAGPTGATGPTGPTGPAGTGGTLYQAFGQNAATETGEGFTGAILASKDVPAGFYQVTGYVTTDITDLDGHDDAGPPLCNIGTDQSGHNITRMIRSNLTNLGPIPWSYTVFIEVTPGFEQIRLKCRVQGFGIKGTWFDPQINALTVTSVQ